MLKDRDFIRKSIVAAAAVLGTHIYQRTAVNIPEM
jgi:hypothetical protein